MLPGGRYATVTHVGHPMGLMLATKELLDWGAAQGLKWDMSPGDGGEQWGCRLENYLTDPGQEPDMSKWETAVGVPAGRLGKGFSGPAFSTGSAPLRAGVSGAAWR